MSGLTPPGPPIGQPPPAGIELPSVSEDDLGERVRDSVNDALIVLAWSVSLALVAASVWWRVTPLAEYTRTAENGSMGEQQLARQVNADGWFFVVALVAGLITGFVLVFWRRRDPLAMVILVTLGAILSTWVMVEIGLVLGPPDPADVLPKASVGETVPLQLKVQATGVYASWGVGALLGALAAIWGTERR